MKTTLNKIRAHSPCREGWEKLLRHLGKTQADDEPLAITTILASNGLDDALWCLRVVEGHDKEIRLYAVWCARQVQHRMTDERSLKALDVAEAFAKGTATQAELDAACAAARAAARDAARDAELDAAGAAAGAAARGTACAAARDAAWAAANAFRRWPGSHLRGDAAWAAARDAALDAQKAKLIEICTEIENARP